MIIIIIFNYDTQNKRLRDLYVCLKRPHYPEKITDKAIEKEISPVIIGVKITVYMR